MIIFSIIIWKDPFTWVESVSMLSIGMNGWLLYGYV